MYLGIPLVHYDHLNITIMNLMDYIYAIIYLQSDSMDQILFYTIFTSVLILLHGLDSCFDLIWYKFLATPIVSLRSAEVSVAGTS